MSATFFVFDIFAKVQIWLDSVKQNLSCSRLFDRERKNEKNNEIWSLKMYMLFTK